MSKELIIFDFDGVLADSFNAVYPLIRNAMNSVGINLSEESYRNLFFENVHSGFKKLITNESDYEKFKLFRSDHFDRYYQTVRLFPGIVDFIKNISNTFSLSIASSGQRSAIVKLLTLNNLMPFFVTIEASNEQNKEIMVKKTLDSTTVEPDNSYFISDTVGDLVLAKRLNMKTIAVSWGFHSAETLKNIKPDFLANTLQELVIYLT